MKRSPVMPVAILGAAAVVVVALVVSVGATTQPTGSRNALAQSIDSRKPIARDRLPDLDQEVPSEIAIQVGVSGGRQTYALGFRSAVRNIGAGPLIVKGARVDTRTASMNVRQIIDRTTGPQRVVPNVGLMKYTVSPDHRHWHYLQFDRYELRTSELRLAGSTEALVTDRKTGFCLGDRYRVSHRDLRPSSAKPPPRPVYVGRCGLAQPGRLRMSEGISVGYGDDYSAFLEGQDLPLDGLRAGRYVLVHRVNANRRLKELSYTNNAASVLFDLRWHRGSPYLRVLATCPNTDRCERRGM
jgi:hypothetical protein